MDSNQFGVILEEIRDMFKTLAEGQTVLENRMDKLENDVDELKTGQAGLKSMMTVLNSRQTKLENELRTLSGYAKDIFLDHEERIKKLERHMG
ncbi:hypothetical protein SY88_11240 [Clostridiales bacterium PH28_bin88]|nr:hypothetical protein SY88_11240 [Clostridiales bacterium PH28_bin88]